MLALIQAVIDEVKAWQARPLDTLYPHLHAASRSVAI